jgi:hypothetical protein
MIFQPLPPQSGQTVSVGMTYYYRAGGRAALANIDKLRRC